jgi:hypothetical protein
VAAPKQDTGSVTLDWSTAFTHNDRLVVKMLSRWFQFDPNLAPDTDFEAGEPHHLCVGKYQFKRGSPRASVEALGRIEREAARLNRQVEIPCEATQRDETLAAISHERERAIPQEQAAIHPGASASSR